jgi:group I intron endonuclease
MANIINKIYALVDPRDNKIRYIGQTNNIKLRFNNHMSDKSKTYKVNWIKQLKNLELKPIIKIIGEYPIETIDIWEVFWINHYKFIGCDLTNLESGGSKNKKHSEESKLKMIDSHLGEKNHFYNKKHSDESKNKQSESKKEWLKYNKHPMLGKTHPNKGKSIIQPTLTCPHCNITCSSGNAKRWHFDNCKKYIGGIK